MQHKDCIIKILVRYNDDDGVQMDLLRLDYRKKTVDSRLINRIIRKYYKHYLGISIPKNMLKYYTHVTIVNPYDEAPQDKVEAFIQAIQDED